MRRKQLELKPIDRDEAETADFVVCVRLPDTSRFTDNVTSACTSCGAGIYYRPDAPTLPRKVCLQCGVRLIHEWEASR